MYQTNCLCLNDSQKSKLNMGNGHIQIKVKLPHKKNRQVCSYIMESKLMKKIKGKMLLFQKCCSTI